MDQTASPDTVRAVADVITFLQTTFSVVMALSITEAFQHSITSDQNARTINWKSVPSLIAFLALAFPFFQGMSRYFFTTYGNLEQAPQPYSVYLFIDTMIFFTESAIFFIMTRCLDAALWRRFYVCILIMSFADLGWLMISYSPQNKDLWTWILLDIGISIAIIALFVIFWRTRRNTLASTIGMIAVILRSVIDYWLLWESYFPPLYIKN